MTICDTQSAYVFTTAVALREHLCRHFEEGSNFHRSGDDLYAHIPEHCGKSGRTRVPAYENDLNAVHHLLTRLHPTQQRRYVTLLQRRTELQQLARLEAMPAPELACAMTRALALADLIQEMTP